MGGEWRTDRDRRRDEIEGEAVKWFSPAVLCEAYDPHLPLSISHNHFLCQSCAISILSALIPSINLRLSPHAPHYQPCPLHCLPPASSRCVCGSPRFKSSSVCLLSICDPSHPVLYFLSFSFLLISSFLSMPPPPNPLPSETSPLLSNGKSISQFVKVILVLSLSLFIYSLTLSHTRTHIQHSHTCSTVPSHPLSPHCKHLHVGNFENLV